MKKIMLVFGTRPEAVKMCPLVIELKKRKTVQTVVCVTGQHREMLDQVLSVFGVRPDYDLAVMRPDQDLFDITGSVLDRIRGVLEEVRPDVCLVHGDTTTAFSAALACFYLKIPVGHVEAGLRTYDVNAPFPEEFNRQAIGLVASYHFAPTAQAAENLAREGRAESTVFITGNTVIDALRYTVREEYTHPELEWARDSKLIFITAHRRENIGEPMRGMFRAIRRVMEEHAEARAVFPVHMNSEIRRLAEEELGGCDRIHLITPLDVLQCHNFESRCYLCLTDSGGLQEEVPYFGKPVLVMRDRTERPEGVNAGTLRLIGTREESVYRNFTELLTDRDAYDAMAGSVNPYGDGHASERIADIVERS